MDCAKSFAIFLVILLHAGLPEPFRPFIRLFLIPAFFFLSGLFAKVNPETSYAQFLKNKTKTILVPYLCFNVVNYVFWLLIGRHYGIETDLDIAFWRPLLGILYGNASMLTHCVPLWFLPCLFVVENIYFICFRYVKKVSHKLLLLLVFAVLGYGSTFLTFLLPWGINAAMSMMLFYGAGNIIKELSGLEKAETIRKPMLLGIMLCSFVIMWIVRVFQQGETKVFSNQYGNYLCFLAGAYVGIVFFCAFAMLCTAGMKRCPRLFRVSSYIGQNTLIVLCLHLMAGSFIKAITVFVFGLPLSIYSSHVWVMLLYSILSLMLLLPVIAFVNRYLPFCLGRAYEKHLP